MRLVIGAPSNRKVQKAMLTADQPALVRPRSGLTRAEILHLIANGAGVASIRRQPLA